MDNIYWNKKGAHQADFDRLCDELIPDVGKADTVAGEILRAATRLAHDFYNNGMGNNTSGAANFLLKKGVMDHEAHSIIYYYTRGTLYDGRYKGDSFQVAIERVIDFAVEMILANPDLTTKANDEDMFDYEDPDEVYEDDEDDEYGYY